MEMNPVDITEGLERIQQMFPEDHVHEVRAPKNPIEAMEAAGIDMDDVREAVGGRFENILHAEQIDQASWRLQVRRITPSGNYTETITVTANSDVLAESTEAEASKGEPIYRLTPQEAAGQVVETLGNHLVKIEAVRGDDSLLALHVRENRDTQAIHRIFSDLNASLHQGGWHATMRENKRWTMSPMAGAFLEKRATLRAAGKGEHLYPPAYYADRSTEAMLRSSEIRDNVPVKEGVEEDGIAYRVYDIEWKTDGKRVKLPKSMTVILRADEADEAEIEERLGDEISDETGWLHNGFKYEKTSLPKSEASQHGDHPVIKESDARKRAFKAGYPMTPLHALAHSTDTIMYPSIGDNDKVRNSGGSKNKSKDGKKKSGEGSMLNKAVSASGNFL